MQKLATLFIILSIIVTSSTNAQEVTTLTSIVANGGVTVESNGDIIASHFGPLPFIPGQEGKNVYRITPNGDVTLLSEDVVLVGTGNTTDSQGNIYQGSFQENKIVKLDHLGNVVDDNFASVSGPVGVLAIANDTIVVCSCNSNAVLKIAQDGSSMIFATGGSFACANGITMDDAGNLYTSNFSNGVITKISPDGTTSILGDTGSGSGHIAFRSLDQMLYIASYGSHQIFRMDLSGNLDTFAGTGAIGALDNTDPLQATFSKPNGIEVSNDGCSLYITQDEDVLREIKFLDGSCNQTGIENLDHSYSFGIIPNPVFDTFRIENYTHIPLRAVKFIDVSGAVVIEIDRDIPNEIDISSLPSGIYTLLLTNYSGRRFVKKMIKK